MPEGMIDYRDQPPAYHEDEPQPGQIVQLGDGTLARIASAKDEGRDTTPLYTVATGLASHGERTPGFEIRGEGIAEVLVGAADSDYVNEHKGDMVYRRVLLAKGHDEAADVMAKMKELTHVKTRGWYGDPDE